MAEQLEVTKDAITTSLAETVQSIRDYTESQVDTWQQLPWFALQASYDYAHVVPPLSQNRHLYRHGLYRLAGIRGENDRSGELMGTYIDCASGKILRLIDDPNFSKQETDEGVLRAWIANSVGFDAASELARLTKVASHHHSLSHSQEAIQQWRTTTAQRLGLLSVHDMSQAI